MSNKKLIGAIAITGGVLAFGSTAVAFGSDGNGSEARSPEVVQQHQSGPGSEDFRNDHGERYDGSNYRGDYDHGERYHGSEHRGNPWPEFCSTDDPAISGDRAEQIALEKVPGAKVTEVELDRCYGMEWEIELEKGNMEYDVDINADNGQITEFEQEEDDDD